MTYTNNLKELTDYLAAFVMEEIGNTTIATPLFEEIQAMMAGMITNGIEAFCSGDSPSTLRYEVNITVDDINKPIIFEQWCVCDIREYMEQDGWTSEDLPTLFKIDDDQFRELLERCASKGYSFYCTVAGLLICELERIAKDYFEKQS